MVIALVTGDALNLNDNPEVNFEHDIRQWDRTQWESSFNKNELSERKMVSQLGLRVRRDNTHNRGVLQFDNSDYCALYGRVTEVAGELPTEKTKLLDAAADPSTTKQKLESLLEEHGPKTWGESAIRSRLLTPNPETSYKRDLFYEDPGHRDM